MVGEMHSYAFVVQGQTVAYHIDSSDLVKADIAGGNEQFPVAPYVGHQRDTWAVHLAAWAMDCCSSWVEEHSL